MGVKRQVIDPAGKWGFRDWIIQRITAITTGAYAIFILLYFLINPTPSFDQWQILFHHFAMKGITFIVLISILWHAWIGLWTVFTDYVKPLKLRIFLEILVLLLLLAYLAWIFEILWGSY